MDRKMMQRIIVIILAAVLLLSIVAPVVMATEAETTAATETEAAEGKGCGGVIGGVGVALVSALAAGVAVKSKKKKEN